MPIIARHDDQTDEKGVMAIVVRADGSYGNALAVYPYDDPLYGYNYGWGRIEDATVFDPEKIKTIEDIERIYGVDVTSHNQGNGVKLIEVVKTTHEQIVVYA